MRQNPYIGLNQIKLEEYINLSPFEIYQKIDEKYPSFEEGQTSEYFLFLYFINILSKNNVDFLIKGGVLLNIYLGEHARRSKDIDVVVKDPELFYKDINTAIKKEKGCFKYKTKWIRKKEASSNYYHNAFSFLLEVYHGDNLLKTFIIDGVYEDDYDKIEKVKQPIPEIVAKDAYFYSVPIEYMASDKLLANNSDLLRPTKHLIDLYALINLRLDVKKVKKYLTKTFKEENAVRKKFNIPTLEKNYLLDKNKEYPTSYYLEAIKAGYQISKAEMIDKINKWINNNLE